MASASLAALLILPTLLLADGVADLSNLRDDTKNTAGNITALASATNGGSGGINVSVLAFDLFFAIGFNLGWKWASRKIVVTFD